MSVEQIKSSPSLEELDGTDTEKNGYYKKQVFDKSKLLNVTFIVRTISSYFP
jgi:hypothetical protein